MCLHLPLNFKGQLNFLEAWLATPCFDEVQKEVVEMNIEDSMHDEEIYEIFRYWSFEEMELYYGLMLQQIDDEKHTTKDNMW